MSKITAILKKIEFWGCVTMSAVMVFACFMQVLNRNILQLPMQWTEELARYAMIWMALLGSQVGFRSGKQMSVEAIANKFPEVVQKLVDIFSDIVCIVFATVTGYYAIVLVSTLLKTQQLSAAMKLPMAYVYMILPVSFIVMAVDSILKGVRDVKSLVKPEKQEEKEGV